jgi:hypothetical protein
MLLLLAACTPPTSSADPAAPGNLRVAVLSDTHIIGPEYVCCSESNDLDNSSIVLTSDRLAETVRQLNAVDPPLDAVFVTGDVVHNPQVLATLEAYDTEDPAWSRARALFDELEMPYYLAWGNHDYDVDCGAGGADPRDFTDAVIARVFEQDPYQAVSLGAWRFLVANSTRGPTWDPADPRCSTGTGSFGAEQLVWMDAELAAGGPTVVMSHHYLPVITSDEDPDGLVDYNTVLASHSNLALTLAGHAHRWLDFSPTYGFPHLLLGSTRYDSDDFWVIELDADGDTYTILDFDKPAWFTTCADTWVYEDGGAEPDPADPAETGDCGS